jgi:hypothetical protein
MSSSPFVTDRLQRLVDSLAERLSLAVLIDDPELRPMAYSAQAIESVDRVRAASILNRQAPPEVVEYLFAQGIAEARGPARVDADEDLGLAPRVCAPITDEGQVLGYLWVIENGHKVGEPESELIDQVAAGAAPLLRTNSRKRQRQIEARIDELLDSDIGISCDAAADLLDAQEFSSSAHAAVLVAKVVPPPDESLDETVAVLLNRGLSGFGQGFSGQHLLTLIRDDQAAVVVGAEDPLELGARLPELGESFRRHVAGAAPDPRWSVAVGIGSQTRSLAGASRSYGQASQAAAVAGTLDDVGPVLSWADMGIYRLLAPPGDGVGSESLPSGITCLLEHPGGAMLLHTLETYLDHGGDAQATTAELFLARGSLYYRIHRIEEIADVNLRSGHDRLMLHVGLKMARICGLYPNPDAAPESVLPEPELAEAG